MQMPESTYKSVLQTRVLEGLGGPTSQWDRGTSEEQGQGALLGSRDTGRRKQEKFYISLLTFPLSSFLNSLCNQLKPANFYSKSQLYTRAYLLSSQPL